MHDTPKVQGPSLHHCPTLSDMLCTWPAITAASKPSQSVPIDLRQAGKSYNM